MSVQYASCPRSNLGVDCKFLYAAMIYVPLPLLLCCCWCYGWVCTAAAAATDRNNIDARYYSCCSLLLLLIFFLCCAPAAVASMEGKAISSAQAPSEVGAARRR